MNKQAATEHSPTPQIPCAGEILVVDDSPSSLRALSLLLIEAGFRVREAPNGSLALWTVQTKAPELILLDVRMPGMDGFELCRHLKADPACAAVPVIFLSAQDEPTDKVLGLQVGGVDFINKSAHSAEILARIDTHLALARVKQTLEAERADLEARVEQRTAERLKAEAENRVLERKLWQAQKMEAVGQLAGGIAHDFNHALSLILGFSEFARKALAAGKLDRLDYYLAEITKASAAGQEIVRNLLAFSRVEEPTRDCIDIAETLGHTVEALRLHLPEHTTLNLHMAPALPRVAIRAMNVQQIITNLILNARDAIADAGGGAGNTDGNIVVTCSPQSIPAHQLHLCASCHKHFQGDFCVLSVQDNGAGIHPENTERLFEPFFTTKDIGQGSGLGLPMVHGMVHSAGGHIEVISNPRTGTHFNTGTRFNILLPAQPGPSPANP